LANEVEYEEKSDRTEMYMIRWKCGFILKGRKTNGDLRTVSLIRDRSVNKRFGHVECEDDADWER